mmetsp:Transcript_9235/g.18828  ORF Transcript_9235/g.18828 Transcript_9235/m.18828 type:complete len:259 (-) Transcript_9235:46-822(-)
MQLEPLREAELRKGEHVNRQPVCVLRREVGALSLRAEDCELLLSRDDRGVGIVDQPKERERRQFGVEVLDQSAKAHRKKSVVRSCAAHKDGRETNRPLDMDRDLVVARRVGGGGGGSVDHEDLVDRHEPRLATAGQLNRAVGLDVQVVLCLCKVARWPAEGAGHVERTPVEDQPCALDIGLSVQVHAPIRRQQRKRGAQRPHVAQIGEQPEPVAVADGLGERPFPRHECKRLDGHGVIHRNRSHCGVPAQMTLLLARN